MAISTKPLAERMRPLKLSEFVGQKHLVGEKGAISEQLRSGYLPSMILWGPPGVGKTTLARLIAKEAGVQFFSLSAIQSGVKEVRQVLDTAKKLDSVILFIDEIHRFNKAQQDALLDAVEKGTIVLIGATTENPSFEVISALLSRCQVYTLNSHSADTLQTITERALKLDSELSKKSVEIKETDALFRYSGGDARKLLNILEPSIGSAQKVKITNELVSKSLQNNPSYYDKNGEQHYDVISAFIKSVRGSDPNASLYYLAKMLNAGEDIKFIARRLIILAAEDVGLANPTALVMANECFQSINVIGMPEARIILSQCTIYLASSPKSNSAYTAINEAMAFEKKQGNLSIPLHLRNAPTQLMKDLDYGKNYQYAHDGEQNFIFQEYLPEGIKGKNFYKAAKNKREQEISNSLKAKWKSKYEF